MVAPLASQSVTARAFTLKPGQLDADGFALRQGYAFIALSEVQPPRPAQLTEVQDRVKADLTEERARERARALAAELRAKAAAQGLERAAAALGLVRKETPGLLGRGQPLGELGSALALDEAAFALSEKTLSDPIPVAAGWAVLRVLERRPFDSQAFEKQKPGLIAALRAQKRQSMFEAYLEQARDRYSVERRSEAFRRVVG
jgi:parvulin-like peptidyl-prolyl isomerase